MPKTSKVEIEYRYPTLSTCKKKPDAIAAARKIAARTLGQQVVVRHTRKGWEVQIKTPLLTTPANHISEVLVNNTPHVFENGEGQTA